MSRTEDLLEVIVAQNERILESLRELNSSTDRVAASLDWVNESGLAGQVVTALDWVHESSFARQVVDRLGAIEETLYNIESGTG